MPSYVNIIIEYLNHHPMIGLVFTFFIAMVESIAILGTIIPGMLTMSIIGMLVGSGIMPLGFTLLISILGALTGDFLSYWFGIRYRDHIYQMWPFKKYRKLMELGEKFFAKHGGKSVVIGRFVGPVRSMVPLIAGLLQMRLLPFSFAAIISATAWSIIYMFPGVFLGALSMELPKWKALEFLGYALLWIFLIWAAIWITQYLIRKSWKYVDAFLGVCWLYLKKHPKASSLLQLIVNPKDPHDHRQFTLLFLGLFFICLFAWIAESVYTHGVLTQLDLPIFHLLQSFRDDFLDRLMISVTFLGDHRGLVIASGIIFFVYLYRRAFWAAIHWGGLTAAILLTAKGLKWLIHAKRPELYQEADIFSSFPSNHVSLSFALFGFSAVLIATELTGRWRQIPYLIVTILVCLVAVSRIYLGAHWMSDVLGAFFLSLSYVLLFTVSYRRRLNHLLSARFLIGLLPTTLIMCCLINGIIHKTEVREKHRLEIPVRTVSKREWWENKTELPLYRDNRFEKPIQILNISWLGPIESVRQQLLKKGWVDEHAEAHDLKTLILKNLIKPEEDFKLPILPTLYQGQPPVLVMTRRSGSDWIVLELWQSNIHLKEAQKADLWIGVIYTLPHPHKWFSLKHEKPHFKDAIQPLLSDIKSTTQSNILKIPAIRLPKRLENMIFEKDFYIIKIQGKNG